MLRFIGVTVFLLFFSANFFSQEEKGAHKIEKGIKPNEYYVKTTIEGLEGVDIARIKYAVSNKHTYIASSNNTLFSDRNEAYIKFYIMEVPATGILNVELGLVLLDEGEYEFPVEFQYSKNEEKRVVNLPKLKFSAKENLLAAEEIPETGLPQANDELDLAEVVAEKTLAEAKLKARAQSEEKDNNESIVQAKKLEEEKLAREQMEKDLLAKKATEVKALEDEKQGSAEESGSFATKDSITKYTVQLLSLSEFSQARLNTYCKKHRLLVASLSKNKVGNVTKITYGAANSIQEAKQIQEKLRRENGIDESFVAKLK